MPENRSTSSELPESPFSIGMLAQLADLTGSDFDHDRARHAVRRALLDEEEPLARLANAGAELHLHVSPARLPLAEALWMVHRDTPAVFWSQKESCWFTVTSPGWFRLRIIDPDSPKKRLTISRAELVRRLGLNGVGDVVEFAVVQSKRPINRMSSATAAAHDLQPEGGGHGGGHGSHGDGHHHSKVKPEWRFIRLLYEERHDINVLILFAVFSGLLYLATPLAVDAVVSNFAFGAQTDPYLTAILVLALALVGALTVQAIITGYQYFISDVIQRRIFVRTATDLAHRLPRVKASAFDDVHAPELVNRFLDVVTVQKSTALLLLEGINLVLSSFIGMILLSLFHPSLFLFSLLFVIAITVTTWLLGRGAVTSSIDESRMKYDMVNWMEEIAAFPFAFKGPGGYAMARERTNLLAVGYLERRSRHFRILMRQIVGLLSLTVIATTTLLVLGGWLVISQQITLGQFVASEILFGSIASSVAKIGKKLEAWYDAMAAMDKLGHLVDLEMERDDGERSESRGAGIEVKATGLCFGYGESGNLFEGLNFAIPPGGRAAIIGPHGSGASSMLDLLFGLREPTSGHIGIDGLDMRSWHLESLRDRVQLLRRNEIVDENIVENLRLGRVDIGMDEIREALEQVGLLESLLSRPVGLKMTLKIGGAPLSANQRTRLLFARALVQRPRLLLVDELFDGLDEETFGVLTKAILGRDLPWTVVLTTRDREVASFCDQIINLAPGHQKV
jgi:putative ABC transport system ATP-binding protein